MIQLYDSGGLCGYDYEGCPVWFEIIGNLDLKGLLLSASKQELIRRRIKACELLLHECELQSQKVSDQDQGLGSVKGVGLGDRLVLGLVCLKGGTRTRKGRYPAPAFPQPSVLQALVKRGFSCSHPPTSV